MRRHGLVRSGQRKIKKEGFFLLRTLGYVVATFFRETIQAIDDGEVGTQLAFAQIPGEALLGLSTVGQARDLAAFDIDVWRKIQGGGNDQGTVEPKVNR